jgi:hypothetical protein
VGQDLPPQHQPRQHHPPRHLLPRLLHRGGPPPPFAQGPSPPANPGLPESNATRRPPPPLRAGPPRGAWHALVLALRACGPARTRCADSARASPTHSGSACADGNGVWLGGQCLGDIIATAEASRVANYGPEFDARVQARGGRLKRGRGWAALVAAPPLSRAGRPPARQRGRHRCWAWGVLRVRFATPASPHPPGLAEAGPAP